MLLLPDTRYETVHAIKKYGKAVAPNSSNPIKVQAIGVLVAPEKTAIKPIAAEKAIGKSKYIDNMLPSVAPIKNKGVTSPPLKPDPNVMVVKSIFKKNTSGGCEVLKLS